MAPHHRNLHRSILDAIAHPVGYALQHDAQGHAVGFGLAVLERGAVGLYDLAVAPEHRAAGADARWCRRCCTGAPRPVQPAPTCRCGRRTRRLLRLYESMGFKTAYGYHYRVPG